MTLTNFDDLVDSEWGGSKMDSAPLDAIPENCDKPALLLPSEEYGFFATLGKYNKL